MARVGIDARLTRQMSVGMKHYTRELLARAALLRPEVELLPCGSGENFSLAEQVGLPLAFARARVRLVHYPTQYLPLFRPIPYVLTIHDLIHCRFAELYEAKVAWYYRMVVAPAARAAKRIIVGDERNIEDCERYLGVDARMIRVVPLGVGAAFLAPVICATQRAPYLFYAGNHREHKDLPTLLEAWSSLEQAFHFDLLLTGDADASIDRERYERYGRRLIFVGDLNEEDLIECYTGATALVHPALWEGFGLTMLEAMALGTPVVACSDAIARPLAAAAFTFPPRDAAALRAAIERVASDPTEREERVRAGRAAAMELTWDRFAYRIAAVYAEVLS